MSDPADLAAWADDGGPVGLTDDERHFADQDAEPPPANRHAFLQALHPDGFRDLRALRRGRRAVTENIPVADLVRVDTFANQQRAANVYVGVATRRDAHQRDGEGCVSLAALHVDLDFKDFPSEAAARARLAAFPLLPSVVIGSGGGLQCYWLLDVPLSLDDGLAYATALLRALAVAVGGDLSAAEPVRILRLPGSFNYKYDPPRPVAIEAWHPERRYALADVLAVLPVVEEADAPVADAPPAVVAVDLPERVRRARAYLATAPPAIEQQHGDKATFKICCAVVRGFDLPDDAAYDVLQDWNARCQPKWSKGDLRSKIAGARKYGEEPVGGRLPLDVRYEDFYAYMPLHQYHFVPTREFWPAASVNARLVPVRVGTDKDGDPIFLKAHLWLDQQRPVEQLTWAPGLPLLIRDRLVADGGWIDRPGLACLNLYRPPPLVTGGDAERALPWIDLVRTVYPQGGDHVIAWLAHRVQRPGEKINHALLLGGGSGIGKDTILEPVKRAVGSWNFTEVNPTQLTGRFNGFLKSVILRISEVRDLGEQSRYEFYEHLKVLTASPPDVLRVDEKNIKEHVIVNVCGLVYTTNHETDCMYLPPDDRRHYVLWSPITAEVFPEGYWTEIYSWYEQGGYAHVAAYLQQHDLSGFNPKAPPLKTPAFWNIVDANRSTEDAELADALDACGHPPALTLRTLFDVCVGGAHLSDLATWLIDRKNARLIPHRMKIAGYTPHRNPAAKDGLWKIAGRRQAVYVQEELTPNQRQHEAERLAAQPDAPVSEVSGPSLDQ